ncbi:uncharacterized protein LOC105212060 [Zeugodacus cucurbitae]|uniref:uncharacterized protein LOC105212060 n=1 Tax=Zeugodacus cucurbitae TaxID=28588 RepID=UPI0023D8E8E3|nr:uncharacterized protein LOC105212060 [Zeugodacus cucurbitae]XP_011182123.2 uncharacterized protein LOC105212060 [Zeugodacus cucurbitae]
MGRISGCLLCTLVLIASAINYSNTAPAPAHEGMFKFETEIERTMFEFFVNLFKYLHASLDKSRELLEQVLKDEVIVQKNDLEKSKELLMDYIVEAKERVKPLPADISTVDGFLYIVTQIHTLNTFEDIVQRYNTTSLPKPTDEDILIEAALKRNGLDALISELKNNKMVFFDEFLRKMGIYVKNLSEEDRIKNNKVVEWYQKYTDSTDEQKANDVFTHFAQMFARF